ncbi:hypothetical protein [Mucilaginibacter phyllosphaerae]
MAYEFTGTPIGPYYGANRMLVVKNDEEGNTYQLNIFPDLFNEQLRAAGRPLQFWYLPDSPRMARFENGNYMFHFTKFAGVLTADDNIAVASPGQLEVAGGVLAFTSTLKIPDSVIANAIAELKQNITNNPRYSADRLFKAGSDTQLVDLGVVPIIDNDVYISSLTPENVADPNTERPDNPWLWKMQGEGKGTINPVGNNAYTAMVGQYPAQLLEAGFHGASSPIFVHNTLKHKFYTGSFNASIHGDWSAIYNHFSADVKASYLFVKGEIQAAFNSAVQKGIITKSITIDNEILTPEREKLYEAQVDKTFDKFMEIAQKVIFDPQPPKVENAKAADTGAIGVSFALKFEHNETHLQLDFREEINETYIKDNTISAHLMGFYETLKDDPANEAKYFDTVHLAEGFRKIHVIASARAFWPDENGNGGDPIEQLLLQVGYPDSTGAIVYKNSGLFMDGVGAEKSAATAPAIWTRKFKDRIIIFDFERQNNLPADQQSVIYIKREIRFLEKPNVEVPDHTLKISEEQTTEHSIEVKAEVLGTLRVGPIELDTTLDDRTKMMITFKRPDRDPVTLRFTADTLGNPQFFEAWTADPKDAVKWSYQVTMIIESRVAGIPSVTYTGDEIDMAGSVPLIAKTPFPPADIKEQIDKLKKAAENLVDF